MSSPSTDVGDRRTARLRLRRPVGSDVAWLTAVHADPANYEHAPDGPNPPERAARLSRSAVEDWERDGVGYWIVCESDEPVGVLGLKAMTFAGRRCWNLYYRFVPAARGRGLAAEAAREALVVARELDRTRPVVVRTRPGNAPARRLAETLGFWRRPDLDESDGLIAYVSQWPATG